MTSSVGKESLKLFNNVQKTDIKISEQIKQSLQTQKL